MKKLLGHTLFYLVYLPGDLACTLSFPRVYQYLMGKSIDINDYFQLHHWKHMEEGGKDGL